RHRACDTRVDGVAAALEDAHGRDRAEVVAARDGVALSDQRRTPARTRRCLDEAHCSTLMLRSRTTLVHFASSVRTRAANSSPFNSSGSYACCARNSLNSALRATLSVSP